MKENLYNVTLLETGLPGSNLELGRGSGYIGKAGWVSSNVGQYLKSFQPTFDMGRAIYSYAQTDLRF